MGASFCFDFVGLSESGLTAARALTPFDHHAMAQDAFDIEGSDWDPRSARAIIIVAWGDLRLYEILRKEGGCRRETGSNQPEPIVLAVQGSYIYRLSADDVPSAGDRIRYVPWDTARACELLRSFRDQNAATNYWVNNAPPSLLKIEAFRRIPMARSA